MKRKIHEYISRACDSVEIIIAFLVAGALLVTLVTWLPSAFYQVMHTNSAGSFLTFLEEIFNFVVGIEFIKMLTKPSTDNIIEVLIFLVARHLILAASSSVEIFLSVASIVLLIAASQAYHFFKRRREVIREQELRMQLDIANLQAQDQKTLQEIANLQEKTKQQ